jgi:hypothetical protein
MNDTMSQASTSPVWQRRTAKATAFTYIKENFMTNNFAHFTSSLALTATAVFLFPAMSEAQSLPNYTNFPMIGLVRGQTLQINIVAYPPVPCSALLGFQDVNGNPLGTTSSVELQAGQSASLTLNGNSLASVAGQRIEVQPVVTPTVTISSSVVVNRCSASAEIYDNVLSISSVAVPGAAGFPPSPNFGMIGVTELQTVELNVVAFPPDPCVGELSFLNAQGVQVGKTLNVQLAPGQASSLDLPGGTLVTKLGQRAEVQPVVTAPNGGCVASTEVYINGLGATSVYFPPVPCSSGASCVVP